MHVATERNSPVIPSSLYHDRLHEQDKEYGQAASLYTKYLTVVTSTGVSSL